MRLDGQAKIGYYPTPAKTLQYLPTWLSVAGEGLRRYLDPCAGQGEALAALAATHGPAETFGIELSDVRAALAQQCLSQVINTGYEYAALTDETFSLILLNPPYDGASEIGTGKRLEEIFLLNTTSRLVPGGILIYIIPHVRLGLETIARHLLGWYSDLRLFKTPPGEYEVFKQSVIFGVRRAVYKPVRNESLSDTLTGWAAGQVITNYTERFETSDGQRKKVRTPIYADMPDLVPGAGQYVIPPSPLRGKHGAAFKFQYQAVSEEDLLREANAAAARLEASREWSELVPPAEPLIIRPVMTPKRGHIAMQVSGGLLGSNLVASAQGQALLLKGNVRKYTVVKDTEEVVDEDEKDNDESDWRKVELEERFEHVLTTLDDQGAFATHTQPSKIAELLNLYIEQLAKIVQARNVPEYDMHPKPWEWAVFDTLSADRRLPGRKETGLTDFQKHLAIALGRHCLHYSAGFVNAEMASGKSSIGLAIAEYLHATAAARSKPGAYPGLIVGPGIVTGAENWPKEICEVVPGATSRVITLSAKPLPKPMKIGAWLEHTQSLTFENSREFEFNPQWKDNADKVEEAVKAGLQAIRQQARNQRIKIPPKVWPALAASFKATLLHPPMRRKGARQPNLLDGRIGGYAWLGLEIPRDESSTRELAREYSLAQFVQDYRSGELPLRTFAIMSYETAKLGPGRIPALTTRLVQVQREDEIGNRWEETQRVCACPHCGAVVSEKYDKENGQPLNPILPAAVEAWIGLKRRYCQAPTTVFNPRTQTYQPGKWVWDEERGKHVVRQTDANDERYVCGAPLFENTALRRESTARYVARHARNFFGLTLIDEVHKAKAKGTAVGWTLAVLSQAARYTVGLTGTLFGGLSSSIFWLLYRLMSEVRQEFKFNDERRWAERYGLLKTSFYVDGKEVIIDDSAFTGTRFVENVSERPGISPAIVGLALKYCTFSSLLDVGLPLPEYSEEIVRLPMTEAMRAQMWEADGSGRPPRGLLRWALDTQKTDTGKGAIGVWLNVAFNRPDAMFRGEVVKFNRRLSGRGRFATRKLEIVMTLPAVIKPKERLPKEDWLVKICQQERTQARRVLVYVRQTDKRDIQPRLAEILTAAGLRVGILRPTVPPAKRATWIKKNAPKYDVLLTNARLVEMGLNLTMFNTAIFYEMERSLYIAWQAMRRLYRPGALRAVKIYFPVYRGTVEETALDLMGVKMLAASCFYGDEVSSALVEESDDSDLLNDLVRKALGKLKVGRAEGLFTFGSTSAQTEMSPDSLGSPAPVPVTMEALADRKEEIFDVPRSRSPKSQSVLKGQIALF